MTKTRAKAATAFLLSVLVAVALIGCGGAGGGGLKDEDAIKAIQTTVESNTKGYKLSSPIVLVEKGAKLPSGELPYKAEYTITLPDGSTKKEVVSYKISPGGVDSMGVNVWNAVESK